MITGTNQCLLRKRLRLGFDATLHALRSALEREGLQIICEVPFHREFKKTMGVECRRYSVLVVWSQFEAYRALLTEQEAGLFTPFNIVVAEDEHSTVVAVNRRAVTGTGRDTVGLSLLARDLEAKIQRAFAALDATDHPAEVLP